jgi:DNA-binding LytR/AlgR family response regulator
MAEPLKVLIVEDEGVLALELEGLLEEAGHEVVGWATSYPQACALLQAEETDLAFVDVNLGEGRNGIDVARFIQQTKRGLAVFFTANPGQLPADFVGAVGVIVKPYTTRGLITALRYLHEGIRSPPPWSLRPDEITLAPSYLERLS